MLELVVLGLAAGSVYSLLALSLVLVDKTSGVVNFAQGEIAMFATFVSFYLLTSGGVAALPAVLAAVATAVAIALLVERFTIRPILHRPEAHAVIMTAGIFLILNAGAGWAFGSVPRGYPTLLDIGALRIGGFTIPPPQLLTLVTTAVLCLALWALFRFTRLGLAMRATQQNRRAAMLMGVRVGTVFSATWALGGVLAAIAGILIAPITGLSPQFMVPVLVSALAAAVIGGFGSVEGAVLGGLLLGVAQVLVGSYLSLNFQEAVTFAVIIAILVTRPQGLLGTTRQRPV